MTFGQAVARLITRVRVDLEAEIDDGNLEEVAAALIHGAKRTSRDAYLFWKTKADLSLGHADALATAPEYNLLNTNICEHPIFQPEGVHINGAWLTRMDLPDFESAYSDYYNQSTSANPSVWTCVEAETIRISEPPNSTAIAATDNFVRGWAEYPLWNYGNYKDAEMLGPSTVHLAYVNRAALDITVSYAATEEGYARRKNMEREYSLTIYGGRDINGSFVAGLREKNLQRVRPLRSSMGAGQQRNRRFFGIGNFGR